jgi:hypothetical protein
MATLDAATVDALNALLEDVRASVMIELALTNGATELRERDTLAAMGSEEVLTCCALRERLALANAPVTWRISGIAFHILGTERYDERLRAFARHQAAICERAEALLATVSDRETHRALQDLYDSHVRSARWAEQRANEFAATRLLDFTIPAGARLATTSAGMAGAKLARADGSEPNPAARPPSVPQPGSLDVSKEAGDERRDAGNGNPSTADPAETAAHDASHTNSYAPSPDSASPESPPRDAPPRDNTIQDGKRDAHLDLDPPRE